MAAKLVYPPVPRHFNTSGPCLPDLHLMLPPLPRLSEAQARVERGDDFVLRAPRRSGVTTALIAFARALTTSGAYAAVYATCETAEASGDDTEAAQQLIMHSLVRASRLLHASSRVQAPLPSGSVDINPRVGANSGSGATINPRVDRHSNFSARANPRVGVGPSLHLFGQPEG